MNQVLLPLMDGFEEIEAITLIDVLRRGGVQVTTAVLESVIVSGAHGVTIMTDCLLEHTFGQKFDLVVLPGGAGTFRLKGDERLKALVCEHYQAGKLIGAICAAPTVLVDLGILENKNATAYPGVRDQMIGVNYSELLVVVDGNVITSQGAGTALLFSLKLLELLEGEAIAKSVAEKIVYHP